MRFTQVDGVGHLAGGNDPYVANPNGAGDPDSTLTGTATLSPVYISWHTVLGQESLAVVTSSIRGQDVAELLHPQSRLHARRRAGRL